jgi:hypothetical protein
MYFWRMKNMFSHVFILFSLLILQRSEAQQSIYDQDKVNSIFISLNPDSLQWILDNPDVEHYLSANFIYSYENLSDTVENIGFRLRGNTSRYSQKKSFKISFNEFVPGKTYQEVKKLNLNGQHNDPSMIREKLFYDVWNSYGMPERRSSFVKLFINNKYYGLYTNIEEFDKKWLNRTFPDNNGNLYKCTYPADMVYLGEDQSLYKDVLSGTVTGGRAYDLQTNETADDYSGFIQLVSTLNIQDDNEFMQQIVEILDVENTLKAFAFDVISGNWDDYMYNKNNFFLYQSQITGKFTFITYDTDNTFGIDWVDRDWATRECTDWVRHGEARPLANRLLSIPEFMNHYIAYLDTITRLYCNESLIFPHIDSLMSLITEAAIADTMRTKDYGYTIEDFLNSTTLTIDDHSPYGIKPFISTRNQNTLHQLLIYADQPEQKTGVAVEVFPNPFTDRILVKSDCKINNNIIEIISIDGKAIWVPIVQKASNTLEIEVGGLLSGIYLLRGNTTKGSFSKKIIKL